MNNLYEVLEVCLQALEQGADVDAVLFRYPDLADELRPILEASVKARDMAVPAPSAEVVRRNRAKVLQRAAQMREAKAGPRSRSLWLVSLRRVAVTVTVLAAVLLSGTGLVRAASTTLPGDDLYPVKRTWEDVTLFFTFDAHKRETLEVEHENERLEELRELFAEGRSVQVTFAGMVTRQNGNQWRVAGFPVVISPQTDLPPYPVLTGAAVQVTGSTRSDGSISAEQISLLPAGASLPVVPEDEHEAETPEAPHPQNENESGAGSEVETPAVEATATPMPAPALETFNGIVDSMDGGLWTINGQPADVSNAQIIGTPAIGASVIVEGYLDAEGVFVVTTIEFVASAPGNDGSGGGDNGNGSGSDNSNDNGNENENENENHNENSNENSNDHGNENSNGNGNSNDNGGG